MRRSFVWCLVAVLFILHQDFWNWSDTRLVLGFVPVGLAYQIGISVAAALVWVVVIRLAWPRDLERWASPRGDGGD
jgi:hypothetical protein